MSLLQVSLSTDQADKHWGDKAPLSFDAGQAAIHLPDQKDLHLRSIKKAARLLESLAIQALQLRGDWHPEQQWAFAQAFTSASKQPAIHWCEDQHKSRLQQQYQAMLFTRNLINRTPEDISPQKLASEVTDWLREIAGDAITARTLTGEALLEAGWAGIYHVGRGSERPPVLLELDYNPGNDNNTPVSAALVGKGITFDSGGYSIKSSEGMLTMKCDMGGAATVAGGLGLAIMQGLNKRVRLFLCCAENLISGHAYKLGDIISYKNGVTVEVVNTDAEGRLVLADGLMAATETGAPLILDAATLTGAAVMALGNEYNALFSMDKSLQDKVLRHADSENEPAWPLPLEPWHQEMCPSPYADTANSRPMKGGGAGGASNAAGFLARFAPPQGKGWIHMDLAAAFNGTATATMPAGATAQGIRTIARTLLDD